MRNKTIDKLEKIANKLQEQMDKGKEKMTEGEFYDLKHEIEIVENAIEELYELYPMHGLDLRKNIKTG